MRILIVTDSPAQSNRGNRITALRWKEILGKLGYQVAVAASFQVNPEFQNESREQNETSRQYDILVALHARRSHDSIVRFRKKYPQRPIIVCLTGTDLHIDFQLEAPGDPYRARVSEMVSQSMDYATRIVALEPTGIRKLPSRFQKKCQVIFQSTVPVENPDDRPDDSFLVTVSGHLREVKDPFRTALATRLLPDHSRIKVVHLGEAITDEMRRVAEEESKTNPRYQWLGLLSHNEAVQKLAGSHLTVLSSRAEGAPGVISEAIVNGVPVLASRIDGITGLLGSDYQGLFDFGNTRELADLLLRAELDGDYLCELTRWIKDLAPRFSPENEANAWQTLLETLD